MGYVSSNAPIIWYTYFVTSPNRVAGIGAGPLLVERDYKGFRIEVNAQHADGAWDVEVRIRRTLSEAKPHVERVTCRKPTAMVAEQRGVIYARRWVDRHGDSRITEGRP